MRTVTPNAPLSSGFFPPGAIAAMITRRVDLTSFRRREDGKEVWQISDRLPGCGNVLRVLAILLDHDRPDRPAGICAQCWSQMQTAQIVLCDHRNAAAIKKDGQWHVAAGLNPDEFAALRKAV
jgi:hypothetical protein